MLAPFGTLFSVSFTLAMSGAAVASRGGEAVDWGRPLIVMANHQSYIDIPVLYAVLPDSFGMLAKRELFRIPLFSSAMHAMRCIPIDRGNRRQSFESLRHAADRV